MFNHSAVEHFRPTPPNILGTTNLDELGPADNVLVGRSTDQIQDEVAEVNFSFFLDRHVVGTLFFICGSLEFHEFFSVFQVTWMIMRYL